MEIMDKIRDVRRSVAVKSGEFAESGKLTYNTGVGQSPWKDAEVYTSQRPWGH